MVYIPSIKSINKYQGINVKAISIKVAAIFLNKSTTYIMVAQQTSPQTSDTNYHKLVYIVWLADYITTCLQTLSHV